MSIFMKNPAAVAVIASVDRGRPRFHEHGIGRHCDSRRDLTVFRFVGDVAEPPTHGHPRPLLIGGGVVPPPYDD